MNIVLSTIWSPWDKVKDSFQGKVKLKWVWKRRKGAERRRGAGGRVVKIIKRREKLRKYGESEIERGSMGNKKISVTIKSLEIYLGPKLLAIKGLICIPLPSVFIISCFLQFHFSAFDVSETIECCWVFNFKWY